MDEKNYIIFKIVEGDGGITAVQLTHGNCFVFTPVPQ